METHIAKRKDHRCDTCGRRIPLNVRYFSKDSGKFKEHTNCMSFESEDILPPAYNSSRSASAAKDEAIRLAYKTTDGFNQP